MKQYNSPYMGMDNRPISSIDPDGGCTREDCNHTHDGGVLDEIVINGKSNNFTGYELNTRDWDILNILKIEAPNLHYAISNRFKNGEYFQLGGGKWGSFSSEFKAGWKNSDPNGIGNFLSKFSALTIGGTLIGSNPVTVAGAEMESLTARGIRMAYDFGGEMMLNGGNFKDINLMGVVATGVSGSPLVELFAAKYEYSINGGRESLTNGQAILNIGFGRVAGQMMPSSKLIQSYSYKYNVSLLHFTGVIGQGINKGMAPAPSEKGWKSPF